MKFHVGTLRVDSDFLAKFEFPARTPNESPLKKLLGRNIQP